MCLKKHAFSAASSDTVVVRFGEMSALLQLRIDALLAILLAAGGAMLCLHLWSVGSKRAVRARDIAALKEVESTHSGRGSTSGNHDLS